MKILFITHIYPDENDDLGGVFIHNQAVALNRAGHDIAVMYLDYRSIRKKRRLFRTRYVIDGITVYRMAFPCGPIYWLINMVSKRLTLSLFDEVLNSFGPPDICYAHFGYAGITANYIKKEYDLPYAVLEHDSGILTGYYGSKELLNRKTGYDNACAVLAVSNALRKELQKITIRDIYVVPNIIPKYMFEGELENRDNSSDFLFISVGNLIKRKSFDNTIKGFAGVSQRHSNIRLIIVGNGPEEVSLKRLAIDLKVSDRIEFLGKINNKELAEIMRGCSCFVLPSKSETFGVVYAEAMACGLPIIATCCGGPEDFVDENNGILTPVDDLESLQKAMERMVDEYDSYDRNFIRNTCRERFSEKVVVDRIISIFGANVK